MEGRALAEADSSGWGKHWLKSTAMDGKTLADTNGNG